MTSRNQREHTIEVSMMLCCCYFRKAKSPPSQGVCLVVLPMHDPGPEPACTPCRASSQASLPPTPTSQSKLHSEAIGNFPSCSLSRSFSARTLPHPPLLIVEFPARARKALGGPACVHFSVHLPPFLPHPPRSCHVKLLSFPRTGSFSPPGLGTRCALCLEHCSSTLSFVER